ncbi:MAG: type IX secretion system membrane protein PorP/SprF [Bacteroidetes bacterium]|nr:type IX secretion system membrane protein PorP/SprF [Bacteroidota bacterium]
MKLRWFLFATLSIFFDSLKAQDIDFQRYKELSTLAQLNPAFSGVLNRFRILSNKSDEYLLGFESRILGSKNYLSMSYQGNQNEDLERRIFKTSYAREVFSKVGIDIRLAADIQFENKIFGQSGNTSSDLIKDFEGFFYQLDSTNKNNFSLNNRDFRLGAGASVLYKNLVFGISARNLNTPDISIQNNLVHNAKIDLTASLFGFVPIGDETRLVPNALYSVKGSNQLLSLGLTFSSKILGIVGQYEMNNSHPQIEFGLNLRFKKMFFSTTYLQVLDAGFDFNQLRITLNKSLFKIKPSTDNLIDNLKRIY